MCAKHWLEFRFGPKPPPKHLQAIVDGAQGAEERAAAAESDASDVAEEADAEEDGGTTDTASNAAASAGPNDQLTRKADGRSSTCASGLACVLWLASKRNPDRRTV